MSVSKFYCLQLIFYSLQTVFFYLCSGINPITVRPKTLNEKTKQKKKKQEGKKESVWEHGTGVILKQAFTECHTCCIMIGLKK